MSQRRVVILGAAGRDFHNFNVLYRDNPDVEVIAFTATQIPDIEDRKYPPELAGAHYPDGIPILAEEDLPKIIEQNEVDCVLFAYSDISHEYVMHRASLANALGADFVLASAKDTMIKSSKPVIAICAVRTGCGKSQTSRKAAKLLRDKGMKVSVVRHPMPYGDLVRQRCQKFETYEDLERHNCTIEEREEYEPHIDMGSIVFAGVDYEEILRSAESVSDVVIWDGGNNDTPFFKPNCYIVVADPHRVGDELRYYPGETNILMADVVVINKEDSAPPGSVDKLVENIRSMNPDAQIIHADSEITLEDRFDLEGKRALVVEDGPTTTHGGMAYGAGAKAVERAGGTMIDPRPFAVGSLVEVFGKYPHLQNVLPAMGYGETQVDELRRTIDNADCDVVVIGTPIDLRRLFPIEKPAVRVRYDLNERGSPNLKDIIDKLI
jgi:predicted GTPase